MNRDQIGEILGLIDMFGNVLRRVYLNCVSR